MNPAPGDAESVAVPSGPREPAGTPRPSLPAPFSRRVVLISGAIVLATIYGLHRAILILGANFYIPLIAALCGVALLLAGPLAALSLYFGTTFAGGISHPLIPISINQAAGVIALAAWGLWIVAGRTSWPRKRYVWLLVIGSVYYVANAVLGEDSEAGLEFAKYIALYELLGFALLTSLRRPAHWIFWFWMILLWTTLNGLVGLTEFVTQMDIFPGGRWTVRPLRPPRINGLSQNAIMFDYMSLWALGPGLFLALEERFRWRKVLAAILTTFIVVMALLTFNRQTPLVLLAVLATGAFLLRHRFVRTLTIGIVAVTLLALPYVAVKMGARLTEAGQAVKDPSYALRRDKFRIMEEMIRSHPIAGIGLGSFPTVWMNYTPERLWFLNTAKPSLQYPDMGYMQMFAESGVVGLGIDVLILVVGARILWVRRRRALEVGAFGTVNLCGVLAMQLVQLVFKQFIQDIFFFPRSWWLFAMIVVAAASPDHLLVHACNGRRAAIPLEESKGSLPDATRSATPP